VRLELLELLRCPETGSELTVEGVSLVDGKVKSGALRNASGTHQYPIVDFIPRFVPHGNYADNFGMQWNMFRTTQLDSATGHPISADRFWKATAWTPEQIRGQWVLDVGCGAGRFAEVVLEAGAHVVAIDYSNAVDACYANLGRFPNLHVLQADLYKLPLKRGTFPFVYCLGVLQHTPDVRAAFHALPPLLLPSGRGRLCVDFYERSWKSRLLPKYALRPLTKRMNKATLFGILERSVPTLLTMSNALARVPGFGHLLKRVVPVANYHGILPLNDRQLMQWALLDTFDWLAPMYDNPQTRATIAAWLQEARIADAEVLKAGHIVGRGRSEPRGNP
jgi:SAM-dependent methyltransferase